MVMLLSLLPAAALWPQSPVTDVVQRGGMQSTYEVRNDAAGTQLSAIRQGNVIAVQGRLKGKALKKDLAIDDGPWYQFIEYALSRLLAARRDTARFWYLDANECEIHEMEARKERVETLPLADGTEEAWRVRVNLTGFASLFSVR